MEIKTFTLYTDAHTHSLLHTHTFSFTRTHTRIPLKMNQRAYISASLRFLASTIISCNSTDTSSERIRQREGENERVREEIKGTQRKLKKHSSARIDRNRGYAVSTGGSAAHADKSFCNQLYSERQFVLPVDQFFVPAIMMNHQRLYCTVGAYC